MLLLYSLQNSIMSRLYQLIPAVPGKIIVEMHTIITNDSAWAMNKMRGTTVMDELLLLL